MGPHNRMAVTEKVDLGASLKKISAYMRGDLALMITALVLAAFGAVLTIVGPDKIGEMTNLMAEGFASGIDMAAVAKIGIFLAVIYGLSAIFTFTQHYIMATVTLKMSRRMRGELSEKINRVPQKYFNTTSQGDILSRITNDVSTLQQGLTNSLPTIISAATQFVGCLIMMFVTEWRLALAALGITLVGLLLGVLFLLGGLCFAQPIARLLGADAQTLGMTTTYLRMLWCFGPFFVMNNVLLAFTRNDGAPTVAMCGMIAGSLFNIVFDYIFIFPCGLGMFGAALATGFSPFVSILVLLTHLRRPSRGFHLVNTPLRVSRVPSLCAPGLSSLIGEIASGVVLLLFNLVLLRLSGNTGVAAYGVVANLALVGIAVFTGLCTGIQPLVSRSSGLGDREQLRRLFRWGICTALGIAAVLCVSVFLGAEPLTAVFNSEHDPQLAAYAESGLRIYFTGFLFAGVNMVTAAFFSASDKTVQGFAISLLRGVIAVPPILFPLAWALGVDGVWLTFPMVELVTAVAALIWARKYIIEN